MNWDFFIPNEKVVINIVVDKQIIYILFLGGGMVWNPSAFNGLTAESTKSTNSTKYT